VVWGTSRKEMQWDSLCGFCEVMMRAAPYTGNRGSAARRRTAELKSDSSPS